MKGKTGNEESPVPIVLRLYGFELCKLKLLSTNSVYLTDACYGNVWLGGMHMECIRPHRVHARDRRAADG